MSKWLGLDISRQDHVDGSDTMVVDLPEYHRIVDKLYPFRHFYSSEDHHAQVKEYFLTPRPQKNIVEKFKLTTGIMQNPYALFNIGKKFALIRGRQGFTRVYATQAPQYCVFGDRTCPKGVLNEYWVTRILLDGLREGEKIFAQENPGKKVKTHVIFAIGREVPSHESVRLVKVALQFDKEDVPAIDFVCDEASHSLQRHSDAIYLAHSQDRDVQAHAGEWVNKETEEPDFNRDLPQLLENIRVAISLGCKTINHARALAYSKPLMRMVASLGIGISSCPGNYLASGYIKDIRELRLDEQIETGVKVFLDHDDNIMFPSLNEVGQMCLENGLTREHLRQMNQNAWDTRPGQ